MAYQYISANDTNPSVNMTVHDLTIYAVSVNTGFVNVTTPDANGMYSVNVPMDDTYQLYVNPEKVADMSRGNENVQITEYPNKVGTRPYLINVSGGNTVTANITGYAPGYYVPPNSMKLSTNSSGTSSKTTNDSQASASSSASSPGFTGLFVLAGMIIAVGALLYRKE